MDAELVVVGFLVLIVAILAIRKRDSIKRAVGRFGGRSDGHPKQRK